MRVGSASSDLHNSFAKALIKLPWMPLSEGARGAAVPRAASPDQPLLAACLGYLGLATSSGPWPPHTEALTPTCLWCECKGGVQPTPSKGLGKCLFILLSASVHSGSKLFITFQMLFGD